jgi:hypothetical protein
MSKSEMDRLVAAYSAAPALLASLQVAGNDAALIAELARQAGYQVTTDDVQAHMDERARTGERDDMELDAVAGAAPPGLSVWTPR